MRNQRKLLEAREYATAAITAGQHPSVIRTELRKRELPTFKYEQPRHQGKREMARRKALLGLCEANCGKKARQHSTLCEDCLAAKYAVPVGF